MKISIIEQKLEKKLPYTNRKLKECILELRYKDLMRFISKHCSQIKSRVKSKVREVKPLKAYCDECCKVVEIDPVEFCKDLNGKSFADIVCKKERHIIATIVE